MSATSSNTLYVMEAANMFLGKKAIDQSASLHLKLTEVKLPSFEEQYQEHRGMGTPIAVEISTIINRFECDFAIVGIDPQVYTLPASWQQDHQWFTFYGVIRDMLTGTAQQAVAVMKGKLGRIDPQNWRRSDVLHTNGQIRAITAYQLWFGVNLIYKWEFFTNTLIVGENNVYGQVNQMLGVPNNEPANFAMPFNLATQAALQPDAGVA